MNGCIFGQLDTARTSEEMDGTLPEIILFLKIRRKSMTVCSLNVKYEIGGLSKAIGGFESSNSLLENLSIPSILGTYLKRSLDTRFFARSFIHKRLPKSQLKVD